MNTVSDIGLGSHVQMVKGDVTGWSITRLII